MSMKWLVGVMAAVILGGGVAVGLTLASAQKTAEAAQTAAEEARAGVQKGRLAQERQEKSWRNCGNSSDRSNSPEGKRRPEGPPHQSQPGLQRTRGLGPVRGLPSGRPTGRFGRRDGAICVWDVRKGEQLACLNGHTGDVVGLAVPRDSNVAGSCPPARIRRSASGMWRRGRN